MTSANATLICASCVDHVATTALSVMDERARGSYPIHSPGGAVHLVGPAPIYDLIGVSELPFCAGCAECGSHVGCTSGCSDCRAPDCTCRCRTLGHTPTEAMICAVCDADLKTSDSLAIAREVEDSERAGRIVSDGCARAIAAQWFDSFYRGFMTHGYLFVQAGAIPAGLRDVRDLLGIEDQEVSPTDLPALVALNRYLRHHGPRESVDGWANVWVRV
jgi:hypothetical protein